MAVSDPHVFPGLFQPSLKQLSFHSHQLLFSHASAEVRGENTPEESSPNRVLNSKPQSHESNTLSNELPGRSSLKLRKPFFL